MAEISEITDSIIELAEEQAKSITEHSKAETQKQLEEMKKKHQITLSKISEEEKKHIDILNKRFDYETKTLFANELLKQKLDFFEEVISLAKEKIKKLPKEDYCAFIDEQLFKHSPNPGSAISFGSEDIKRLPKDFFARVTKKHGLTSEDSFDGYGFIIKEDNFSEIVTLDSIFSEEKPKLMQLLKKNEDKI